jgi:hypothetical protein
VEPADLGEDWDEYEDFEDKLRQFHKSLLCKNCEQLLIDPCSPKKQHFSCQHRVCLECIGKSRTTNCKMCKNFTLFEKNSSTKLVLGLFQELCELVKGSWIYDYIQRRTNHDTGQSDLMNLTEIIECGVNYGRNIDNNLSIIVEDSSSSAQSSSDENSCNSVNKKSHLHQKLSTSVPYTQTFPSISPLQQISPNPIQVQSQEQQIYTTTTISNNSPSTHPAIISSSPEPIIQQSLPIITSQPQTGQNSFTVSQIVHFPSTPIVMAQQQQQHTPIPSSSKLNLPLAHQQKQIMKPSSSTLPSSSTISSPQSFISHVPMRIKQQTITTPTAAKSIMSPMKIHQQQQQQQQQHQQSSTPTIYSVMYTGSGNKITLKRKAPDESTSPSLTSMPEIKTSSCSTNVSA